MNEDVAFGERLKRAGRLAVAALIGVGALILMTFAAIIAACVGLIVGAVALFTRARKQPLSAKILEARRTPQGWTAEPATPQF